MIEEYFTDVKEQMKKILLADTDLAKEIKKIFLADKLSIPANQYPAICLEGEGENPEVATNKRVKIKLEMNIWFYVPLKLKYIDEERAEKQLLKIGNGLVQCLAKNETNQAYWVLSNFSDVEYGYKETDRLLRTGVIRWSGEHRISGGWNNE